MYPRPPRKSTIPCPQMPFFLGKIKRLSARLPIGRPDRLDHRLIAETRRNGLAQRVRPVPPLPLDRRMQDPCSRHLHMPRRVVDLQGPEKCKRKAASPPKPPVSLDIPLFCPIMTSVFRKSPNGGDVAEENKKQDLGSHEIWSEHPVQPR